jgi:hypothetical protein
MVIELLISTALAAADAAAISRLCKLFKVSAFASHLVFCRR